MNAYAADFTLNPGGDDIDGTKYYTLAVKNALGSTNIDVALEGNAITAKIRDHLVFTCKWGTAEGVKVGMSSRTDDGVMVVDSYYFFDDKLNNLFSKSYAVMNEKKPYVPLSLNHSVCEREDGGVKKDSRTGRDYIENYEVISEGPFILKGVPNVSVKYVTNKGLSFIKESESGDVVLDFYKNKNDVSPVNTSLFFMKIDSKMNIVSLISWGGGNTSHENVCYKVYAYTYGMEGEISSNKNINNDVNLAGCEGSGSKFSYTNAATIKSYINKTYSASH